MRRRPDSESDRPGTSRELVERVGALNVWRRGDQRAPHKPLLLLFALARFAEGRERLAFTDVEVPLRRLLEDFGPPRTSHHPEFPFWHLQSDGLWALDDTEGLRLRKQSSSPTLSSLRERDPLGSLSPELVAGLRADSSLLPRLIHTLLDAHFPASLHAEILDAIGLDLEAATSAAEALRRRRRRDPAFREAVLRAYGYACAVCGFSTRLGHTLVGLDAAHVKWHQAGGPDEISNGLALCALHHRLLDRGAFTVMFDGTVRVAEEAHGGEGFEAWLLRFHEEPLRSPTSRKHRVAEPFADWHHREVFRYPSRAPAASAD